MGGSGRRAGTGGGGRGHVDRSPFATHDVLSSPLVFTCRKIWSGVCFPCSVADQALFIAVALEMLSMVSTTDRLGIAIGGGVMNGGGVMKADLDDIITYTPRACTCSTASDQ